MSTRNTKILLNVKN